MAANENDLPLTRLLAALALLMLPMAVVIAAEANYLLLVVFESSNGHQTLEQATVSRARCMALTRRLRLTGPFSFTIHRLDKSTVHGRAVELQCITPRD